MNEGVRPSRKFTVHYATDEDYKRMNFYTTGTLYRAVPIMAHRRIRHIDHTLDDPLGRGLPMVDNVNGSAEG